VVSEFKSGIVALINGNTSGLVTKVEKALVDVLPTAVDMVARQLGVQDLPQRLNTALMGVKEKVIDPKLKSFFNHLKETALSFLGKGGKTVEQGQVGTKHYFEVGGQQYWLCVVNNSAGLNVLLSGTALQLSNLNRFLPAGVNDALKNAVKGALENVLTLGQRAANAARPTGVGHTVNLVESQQLQAAIPGALDRLEDALNKYPFGEARQCQRRCGRRVAAAGGCGRCCS